jgi:galactose-1-phosphate uridylyltransferase
MNNNIRPTKQQVTRFEQAFHVRFADYWDQLIGFDVVKFTDEILKPPNGKSAMDVIVETKGQEIADLVYSFLFYMPVKALLKEE